METHRRRPYSFFHGSPVREFLIVIARDKRAHAHAEGTLGLLKETRPFVLQTGLNDFYVSYELNVYTDRPREMVSIYSDLHQNIQDAFNEHGVQIMSPHYLGDPAQAKIVPKENWYQPPAKRDDGAGSAKEIPVSEKPSRT